MEAVRVEMVGLLPMTFTTCAHCCTTDYFRVCGLDTRSDQLEEYPEDVRGIEERVADLYRKILTDFQGRVIPLAVGTATLRGLWLSLRHRLRGEFNVIVNGRHVLRGLTDYDLLREAIEKELEAGKARF